MGTFLYNSIHKKKGGGGGNQYESIVPLQTKDH